MIIDVNEKRGKLDERLMLEKSIQNKKKIKIEIKMIKTAADLFIIFYFRLDLRMVNFEFKVTNTGQLFEGLCKLHFL